MSPSISLSALMLAQVAEVSVATDGKIKIDRVVCAVDCGVAMNPDVIKAQMEGGKSASALAPCSMARSP